jgi:hypothetical protein
MTDKPKPNAPIMITLAITEMENSPGLYRVFGIGATKDGLLLLQSSIEEFDRKREPVPPG